MSIDLMMQAQAMQGWSVADECALEQLPEDTKALLARALVHRERGPMASGAKTLEEAYREGWRDGVDACWIERPEPPSSHPYSRQR